MHLFYYRFMTNFNHQINIDESSFSPKDFTEFKTRLSSQILLRICSSIQIAHKIHCDKYEMVRNGRLVVAVIERVISI